MNATAMAKADHHQHETIRVLHVDDEPDLADLAATFLIREDSRFEIETATNAAEGLELLEQSVFDCIVSDYDMPGQNGIEFLEAVREEYPDLPFILFTGKGSEEVASHAISADVSDYLQKGSGTGRYALLANRIRNLVSQYRAEGQLETRAQQQQYVADLGNEALAGASLETLFDRAAELVADALGSEYAKVLEYRPEHEDLLLQAGVGWQDGLVGEATVGTDDDSQAGHTIRSEEPIVVEDLRVEDRFRGPPLLVEHDVVSGISVIIGSYDDPWGILGTHTTERTVFTHDDVTFVQNIANVLANAIEREERETELHQKERRYHAVFNDPNILVGLLDIDGTVLDINETALKYVDASLDDLTDTPFWKTPWFDQSEAAQNEVKDSIDRAASGEYIEFTADHVLPNGEPYTVEGVFRPVTNDDGEVVSILISDRDITEQKERERELEMLSRRLNAILDNTTTPMFMKDDEGEYIFVNRGYRELFGLEDNQIVGSSDHELHPSEIAHEVRANDQAVLDQGEAIETEELVMVDGKERTFLSTKVPIYDTGTRSDPEQPVAVFGVASDITEFKDRERELQREQERFRAIFEKAFDAMLIADDNGEYIDANQSATELLGLPEEELLGRTIDEFAPDDFDFDAAWKQSQQSDTARGTFPVVRSDGTERIVEYAATNDIVPGQHLAVLRDVTTRTEQERRLKALNEVSQELMAAETQDDVADIGVEAAAQIVDLEANTIYLYDGEQAGLVPVAETDAVSDLVGSLPTFTGGDSIAWRAYEQDEAHAVDDVHGDPDIYNPETPIKSELYLPLGDYGILIAGSESSEAFDQRDLVFGEILAGSITAALEQVERTERLHAREKELARKNDRLESLFENSPDMIDVLDPAGTLLQVNRRFCDELGYEEDDVLGQPIWEFDQLVDEADVKGLLVDFDPNERRKFEGVYERCDGSTIPVEVHLLRFGLEGADRFLAISRDITERKEREAKIQRQNERLDQFAIVVSHDLRNPLNVAEGRLELAKEECDSEHLDDVSHAHGRMRVLIDDLLTLSREGETVGESEPVDLGSVVESCWQTVGTADTKLTVEVERTIRADRRRLHQLLENLMWNAVEHGGDDVTVTVGALDDGFYVEDDGPGIPEDDRDEVFDASYSTSDEGTGFGLSIVKQIADAHGWEMHVTDGSDGGARFAITDVEFVPE